MTSTRGRTRLGGRASRGLLAPVVVAIVLGILGILGMHGIGAHGVDLHGAMTHSADATPATATVMAGHDTAAAAFTNNEVHPAGDATSVASNQSDGQMGGMVMLCVAMLGSAALALLAVLAWGGRLPKVWAVLEPAGRVLPVVSAVLRVGAGPPAVWRFSVIRC